MAPEKYTTDGHLLDEAELIADKLLTIQEQVNQAADRQQAMLLDGVRETMGYQAPDAIGSNDLVDVRIAAKNVVVTPLAVATVLPLSHRSAATTRSARKATSGIISHDNDRLLVIAGPCSIHDPEAALEYATGLAKLRGEYADDLEILMRAYTEKPRSELGWKGFAYDPYLDGSNRFSTGLIATRMLMCRITDMGVPIAAEPLNALTPQYVNGLVTYNGVGARNVTDQTARERASGTSAVVGFKNSPNGGLQTALAAVATARASHDFLGVDEHGMTMQITTTGNPLAHVILRGTEKGPNYGPEHVELLQSMLRDKALLESIVVDASHDNSGKDHTRQMEAIDSLARQISLGQQAIRGIMIESQLVAGKQPHSVDKPRRLTYGQSITDGCVDMDTTAEMLDKLAESVRERRKVA